MQNYLELFDKLLSNDILSEAKNKAKDTDKDEEEKLLCAAEGKASVVI